MQQIDSEPSMMTSEMEAKRNKLFERMQQRSEEMKSKRAQEQKENPALFWKEFNERIEQQQSAHELQLFLNQHVHYLPNYDVRKADEKIKKMQEELKKDKKVFSFKKKTNPSSNASTPSTPVSSASSLTPSLSSSDDLTATTSSSSNVKLPETNKTVIDLSNFENSNSTIHNVVPTKEKESFAICNGVNQTLFITNIIGAVYISNLQDCTICIGPVCGAVFLSKCTNCTFQLACWQLRIHDSVNCTFLICPKNHPIIENCSSLKFGKYNFSYEGIQEQFKACDMSLDDETKNKWNKVHDFNWLKPNEPSPNFTILLNQ
ncbi:hypothetical protein C9374_002162 [Naegleria lovaniensis]|uniref:C-CAP/cofactor C-like domain-containing protein n=1 Tax=Naegleria lovaniensis TaxID=51637 RepID=A0AA88GQQ8_NAELO|nr:uncharacterized protein C9374_002162 [Naegleria lovaniensis]KAG2387127.1 hypothetical protein C9374_002162 [Naegleria lovaniensis]